MNLNPKELLNDLLASGLSRPEALAQIRQEYQKRKTTSHSPAKIKAQNDHNMKHRRGIGW